MHATRSRRLPIYSICFATLCGVVLLIFFLNRGIATGQSNYDSRSAVMLAFVQRTNDLRAKNNLPALTPSQQLEQSAIAKLQDMQQSQYWGHYSPSGQSFSRFIWQYDEDAELVGENLARCFETYDAAFAALVNSPLHYKVLTGDFTNIGVASQKTASGCESIVMHVSRT